MKLLVTGAWKCTEEQLNEVRSMGHEVKFMQHEQEALACDYAWVEGLICNGIFLHHPIAKFKNLKYIQLTGVGYDRIPLDYIREHGIELHNAAGVYCAPMAEFAISGVLQLYKQSRYFYENQRLHRWEKHRGLLELSGKTVLIVGCGAAGIECAKRFKAFGCRVIGVNRTRRESEHFDGIYGLSELDRITGKADVIVLAIALTSETRHLVSREQLGRMKDSAVLVNISRGEIVDTAALIEAIDSIGGAVLDVFEEEPLAADSPLWDKENVIISPHNSYVGDKCNDRLFEIVLKGLGNAN